MAKSAKGPVDIFAGIKNVKFEGQPPEQTERIKPDINSDKPIEETIKRSEKNETDISQNTENKDFVEKKQEEKKENISLNHNDKKSYLQIEEFDLTTLKSCTVVINPDIYERFVLQCTVNDIKRYDLANSMIKSEQNWENDNPSFPSKEFIVANIKKIKNKQTEGRERLTLNLTPEHALFIKNQSKKCGMKMYTFVEYIFESFLD